MNNKPTVTGLQKMGACGDAIAWARIHGGTSAELWGDCERGDWMAWYLGRKRQFRKSKELFFALADCAAVALKYYTDENKLPHKTLRTLRRYLNGKATKEQLERDWDELSRYDTMLSGSSYWAAQAVVYAVWTTLNKYPDAAYRVPDKAGLAASEEMDKALKKCANIFRKYFPVEVVAG